MNGREGGKGGRERKRGKEHECVCVGTYECMK